VIPQFSEKKLNFYFSFLSCSVALGFEVSGGIPQGNSRSFGIFSLGPGAQMGQRVRAIDLDPMNGSPLSSPTLADTLSLSPVVAAAPSLFLSFPFAAALYPLHDFHPPLDLPPRSKDRKEEEHVELKRKRGSRRCSTPSLLAVFLGETLDKDKIHIPSCNYVFLEVVHHGD
jgi:hypothetical protein